MPTNLHWLWSNNTFLSLSLRFASTELTTKGKFLLTTDIKFHTLPLLLLKEEGEDKAKKENSSVAFTITTTSCPPPPLALPSSCPPHAHFSQGCGVFFMSVNFFPQGCSMPVIIHISSLRLCPECLPSTTFKLLNLFLNHKEIPGQGSLGAFQTLLSVRGHKSQPHSVFTLQWSWNFPRELIHGRSTEQACQKFFEKSLLPLSSVTVLLNRWRLILS